jgi:NAD(P)-dependent dehydrogenase (short-subunit alcohol dehydrogenase family)
MGVTHGVRAFVPAMIERGRDGGAPGVVINVGSKQGITNPPGNAVYNLCKAAVKSYTETLRHALRSDGAAVSAHLLIPGWTTTGKAEHKPGAWLPDRVVELMLSSIDRGDFYILCPDGEVTPEMDHKRVLWGARDIVDNRPPLSRWHGGFGDAYEAFET